jgi:hypothetical protein
VLVLLVLAAGGVAACGSGSSLPAAAPLVNEGSFTSGGWPTLGSYPSGIPLRFIERGAFGVDIVLRNSSRQTLTVIDARTIDPPHSLVHQVGTSLASWNPPACPAHVLGCPQYSPFRGFYGADRPKPVTVRPHRGVGVQLNFRLGACSEVPLASSEATRLLTVTFRDDRGKLRQQTLPLGSAQLRLRKPPPSACLSRPHSQIALSGLFPSSTASTIPGSKGGTCVRTASGGLACSDGDTCTRTAGGLRFRSGLFESRGSLMVRVEIELPRFRGAGLYRTLHEPTRVLASPQVLVIVGIGNQPTFRARTSVVTVTRATPTALGGHLHAIVIGSRHTPFHVSGTWHCTIATEASFSRPVIIG